MTAIGIGIVMLAVMGAGIGLGLTSAKAVESVARNPEASGKILSTGLVFATLCEVTAIFGFVIAIIMSTKL